MEALDIRAIPNEIKQVPTSKAAILFFIILLPIHITRYIHEDTFLFAFHQFPHIFGAYEKWI
jgi:hypothetical protein